jgi:hypothetical protein
MQSVYLTPVIQHWILDSFTYPTESLNRKATENSYNIYMYMPIAIKLPSNCLFYFRFGHQTKRLKGRKLVLIVILFGALE